MPSDSSDWYAANNFMDLRVCVCVLCVWQLVSLIHAINYFVSLTDGTRISQAKIKTEDIFASCQYHFSNIMCEFSHFSSHTKSARCFSFSFARFVSFFSLRLSGIFSFVYRLFVEALWGHVGNCCWYYSREHHYRNTCMRLRRTQIII